MSTINDFSRYKNNELKSYFTKKDIEYYVQLKEKSKLKTDAFIVATFTFLLNIIVSKDIASKIYNNELDLLSWFIIVFKLLFPIIIGFGYYYFFRSFVPFLSSTCGKMKNFFGRTYSEKDLRKFSRSEKIEIFNNEIVNQIALTLEMISDIETKNNIEKKFRLGQISEHLKNALDTLFSMTGDSRFKQALSEYKGVGFIHKESIENVISISEYIISKIQNENKDIKSEKVLSDIGECETIYIFGIKESLEDILSFKKGLD